MWSRFPVVALASLTSASACGLGNYDYLSKQYGVAGATGSAGSGGSTETPEAGAAGAESVTNACEGAIDGTPCDDRNVCTRTSLCVSGACSGTGEAPCTVADSVKDFSMTQNAAEWSYGYWAAEQDADGYQPATDFKLLVGCPDMVWRVNCLPEPDPSFRWTMIMAELEHAATNPELQMPVRRWVSDVSGAATAVLDHHHANPGNGDGTRAILLVDGVSVWEHEIDASGTDGIQTSVPVELEQGTLVELMLNPLANQSGDTTHFSLVLQNR